MSKNTIEISEEDKMAGLLKYGNFGDIVQDILKQEGLSDQLSDMDVHGRIEFSRWIRNRYNLWERYEDIIKAELVALSDVDDHEEHPDQVSYDIAAKVCKELGITF